MNVDARIARIRQEREHWLDLDDTHAVCMRRPGELALAQMSGKGLTPETCCGYVVGWRGFTEADVFEDGDKAVAFDAGLWMAIVEDRAEWAAKITAQAISMITEHLDRKAKVSGN